MHPRGRGTVAAHISHQSHQFIGFEKKKKKEACSFLVQLQQAGAGTYACLKEGGAGLGGVGLSGDTTQRKPISSTKRGMT